MAKAKLIMTAIMETNVDPVVISKLFSKKEQLTTEEAINLIIKGYLDNPQEFVEDGFGVEIDIKYEMIED